jgi:hypothetical protein
MASLLDALETRRPTLRTGLEERLKRISREEIIDLQRQTPPPPPIHEVERHSSPDRGWLCDPGLAWHLLRT